MELTFPLVAPPPVNTPAPGITKMLFHTVDYAAAGMDLTNGDVYLTAYNDRKDIANSLVQILPAYITFRYGEEVAKQWFHHMSLDIIRDVTFNYDEEGNWLGTWKTSEDDQNDALLNEDMGFDLQFEGLDLLEDTQETHTTDDHSVKSWGSQFGRPGLQNLASLKVADAKDAANATTSNQERSSVIVEPINDDMET